MTMGEEEATARRLDLVGMRCPLPVLHARRALREMDPGARLIVVTSDPLASIDIPHLCNEDGHDLVAERREGDNLVFEIARGARRPGRTG